MTNLTRIENIVLGQISKVKGAPKCVKNSVSKYLRLAKKEQSLGSLTC